MRVSQKLTRLLRDLVSLIDEEAQINPQFAQRVEAITAEISAPARKAFTRKSTLPVPDVAAVFQEKGEQEFRFWLRTLDIPTLKAIVKVNGFDPAKASQRWRDSDKFITLITDQTGARLRRGSAFVPVNKTFREREAMQTINEGQRKPQVPPIQIRKISDNRND